MTAPISMQQILSLVTDNTRQSRTPHGVARRLGRDEMDPEVHQLIRSMLVSGFLSKGPLGALGAGQNALPGPAPRRALTDAEADRRFADRLDRSAAAGNLVTHDPGNACSYGLWHEGPCADPRLEAALYKDDVAPNKQPPRAVPRPAVRGGAQVRGRGGDRPFGPSGVVPAGAVVAARGDDGPPVLTDRQDRHAKADVLAEVEPLLGSARAARDALDEGDDPEEVLNRLLTAVDAVMDRVGYGSLGLQGQVFVFDPQVHELNGVEPERMTEQVQIVEPGVTWQHRGETIVVKKARVNLYDHGWGSYALQPASYLESDGDPGVQVWFNDTSPARPPGYDEEGWWTVEQAWRCDGDPGCTADDPEECESMVLLVDGGGQVHIPAGTVLVTTPC